MADDTKNPGETPEVEPVRRSAAEPPPEQKSVIVETKPARALKVAILMVLVGSVGALFVSIAVIFGDLWANAILIGIGASYAVLNVALSTGQVGAPSLAKRLITVTWVTHVSIALAVVATIVVNLWPTISARAYDDFTISIIDEELKPLSTASVTLEWDGSEERNLKLNDAGRVDVRYAKFWGPREGRVLVTIGDKQKTIDITRAASQNFPDMSVKIWSGRMLFRSSYVTATGQAIDALSRGLVPAQISQRFPNIVGVLNNEVLLEVSELLAAWSLEGALPNAVSLSLDGEKPAYRDLEGVSEFRDPRAATIRIEVPADVDQFRRILNLDRQGTLPSDVFVLHRLTNGDLTQTLDEAGFAIWGESQSGRSYETDIYTAPVLFQAMDGASLQRVKDSRAIMSGSTYQGDVITPNYLDFFASRNPPIGMIYSVLEQMTQDETCDAPEHSWVFNLVISMPKPEVRFLILENLSDQPISIDQFLYNVTNSDGIFPEGGNVERIQKVINDPISGGGLAPGEAIAIATRLSFRGQVPPPALVNPPMPRRTSTRSVRLAGLTTASGESLLFYEAEDASERRALFQTSFQADFSQFRRSLDGAGPWREASFVSKYDISEPRVVTNGVTIPLRVDTNRTLMIANYQEWGGSCRFL